MKQVLLFFVVFFYNSSLVAAHGPVHEAIIELTKEIESTPDSIFLYFERGALYKIDEDFDNAIADFEQVISMDNSIHTAIFQLADIYYKKRNFLKCDQYVNDYMALEPKAAVAYQLRGDLFKIQGKVDLAIPDFQKVIDLKGNRIVPREVLQLSKLLNINHPLQAIQTLEYGLEILPANISLASSLIDITTTIGAYKKALDQINQILSITPRKEFWLFRKAEVYEAMGDCPKAKTAYYHSLAEVTSLKTKSKETEFVKSIQEQALLALKYL